MITKEGKPTALFKITEKTVPYPQVVDVVKIKGERFPILSRGKSSLRFIDVVKKPLTSVKGVDVFDVALKTESAKLTKAGYPYVRIKDLGKLTEQYRGLVAVQPIKEGKVLDIFAQTSALKKTVPATRNIFFTSGKAAVVKGEPLVTITEPAPFTIKKEIVVTKPKFGKVTFTTQQAKDIVKTLQGIYGKPTKTISISDTLKVPVKAPTITKSISKAVVPVVKESTIFPRIVSGVMGATSVYAGKGTYEKSEPISLVKPITGLRTDLGLKTSFKTDLGLKVSPAVVSTQAPQEASKIDESLKIGTGLKTGLTIRTGLKTAQQLAYKTKIGKPMPPIKPVPGIPPFELPSSEDEFFNPLKSRRKKLYIGEVRRRGKFISVSPPTEFFKAYGKARVSALRTLGASIRVKEFGTGKIAPVPTDMFFRPAKKEFGVAVQKSFLRLSAKTERREIQKARKIKGWWEV